MPGLVVFDTHPIQYRTPVFRALFRLMPELHVAFFDDVFDGSRWWFHEVGKIPKQTWNLDLKTGFPNEVLNTRRLRPGEAIRALRGTLERHRPDAVAIYGYYLPEHWYLRRACARLGIPLLFIGETFTSRSPGWRGIVKGPLLRYFFAGVSQFISIGRKTETHYRSLGIGTDRITPARYCIDGSFFHASAAESQELRRRFRGELGIPPDAFITLFVGRLFERKRPFDMLEIHRRANHPDCHTVIVGNGPLEAQLAQAAKSVPRFHLAGFRDQAGARAAYHAADLLVVPSEYETWGLVINEAAACGVPSLVTRSCGAADDLVRHDETGLVFDVGDTTTATRELGRLLNDRSVAQRLGARAKAVADSEYTPERFAQAFVDAVARAAKATPREAVSPEPHSSRA